MSETLDIATLGLEVDATPFDKAADTLDGFVAKAAGAEKAAEDLKKTTDDAAASGDTFAQSVARKNAAIDAEQVAIQRSTVDWAKYQQQINANAQAMIAQEQQLRVTTAQELAQSDAVKKLVDAYDPLGPKMAKLTADFQLLSTVMKSGAGNEGTARALGGVSADMDALIVKSGQTGSALSDAGEKGHAAGMQMGLGSAYARRELIILGKEVVEGNFSRIPGTLATLAAHTGLFSAAMIGLAAPLLAAAVAAGVWIYALVSGAAAQEKFNQVIAKTSDYAGLSAESMSALAQSMSSAGQMTIGSANAIVATLASTGQIGGAAIAGLTAIVEDYARVTGQTAEKAAEELTKIFVDPMKGAEDLNKSMHFLTLADLERIQALTDEGRVTEAQTELMQKLTDKIEGQRQPLTYLQQVWHNILGDWNAIMALGAPDTFNQQLSKMQSQLQQAKVLASTINPETGQPVGDPEKVKQLEAAIDNARELYKLTGQQNAADAQAAKQSADDAKFFSDINKSKLADIQKLQAAQAAFEASTVRLRDQGRLSAEDEIKAQQRVAEYEKQIADAQKAMAAEGQPKVRDIDQTRIFIERLDAETKAQQTAIANELTLEKQGAQESLAILSQLHSAKLISEADYQAAYSGIREAALQKQLNLDRQSAEVALGEVNKLKEQFSVTTDDKGREELAKKLASAYDVLDKSIGKVNADLQLQGLRATEAGIAQQAAQAKAQAAVDKAVGSYDVFIAKLDQEAAKRDEINASIGQTEEAVAALAAEQQKAGELNAELLRLEIQLMQAYRDQNEALVTELQREINAIGDRYSAEVTGAGRAAAAHVAGVKALRDQEAQWQQIDGTAHDFFIDLEQNGTSAFKNLGASLKKDFLDVLYQMTLRKWVFQIFADITGSPFLAPGSALASSVLGGGAGGGGLASGASNLSTGYNAATGGITNSATNFATSGVGSAFGLSGGTAPVTAAGWVSAEGGASILGAGGAAGLTEFGAMFVAAAPWLAIGAIAIPLVMGYLNKKSGGPMTRDYGLTSGTDLSEFQQVSDTHKLIGTDAKQTSEYDKILATAQKSYADTVKLLGGTAQDFHAIVYSSMDPKGTAGSGVHAAATLGGKSVYDVDTGLTLSRDPKVIADRVSLETERSVFAAIQHSDLPEKIAAMLGKFSAETISAEEMNTVLTLAESWASLMKSLGDKIPAAVNALFESITPDTLASMDADAAANLTAFATTYATVYEILSKDPMADALKAVGTSSQQAFDAFAEQGKALGEMAAAYDGSAQASKDLTAATNAYYGSLVNLLAQIERVKQAVADMFASSIKNYTFAGYRGSDDQVKQQQYDYYKADAAKAEDALKQAKDVDTINRLAGQINADQQAAFNLLSPEQQRQQSGAFIAAAEQVNAEAQAQLNAAEQQLKTDFNAYMKGIKDAVDGAAKEMVRAANIIAGAGADISDAAATVADSPTPRDPRASSPTTVFVVPVPGAAGRTPSEIGGG